MTPEQLRQNAAAMLAFADGKPVQHRNIDGSSDWKETRVPIWGFDESEYRPKPQPVTRPWNKRSDVPGAACWLLEETRKASECLITSVSDTGITYMVDSTVRHVLWSDTASWKRLLYSTDRSTWHKCEVTEERP